MTLRHMKIYVSVFRLSSMTKAAEELHLAQPSVSLAVRKSETGIHWASSGSEAVLPSEHGFFLPLSPGVRLPFPI